MAAKKDPAVVGATEETGSKKGERAGKPAGPDVDTSFHVYEFTDPNTGEPVEAEPAPATEEATS